MPPKQPKSSRATARTTASVGPLTQQQMNKREKNRRRRQRRRDNRVEITSSPMYGVAPGVDNTRRIEQVIKRYSGSLSKSGMSFLKCAFAPPDFAVEDVRGVPDEFNGLSLIKRHRLVFPFNFNVANTDYYFILAPIPGYAFFYWSGTAGTPPSNTSQWIGITYADSATLFASPSTAADVVSDFRYVSNHIEFIPTVNQMQWSGSLQVMRAKLSMAIRSSQGTTGAEASNIISVNGINAVQNFGNASQYTAPLINGLYAAAYNTNSNFAFSQVQEELPSIPTTLQIGWGDYGQLMGSGSIPTPGLDNNFDSIMIKVSSMGTNTTNSVIIKTWACVEYKVVTGAILYEYQTLSPTDELAMKYYRRIVSQLPTGVGYMDNEGFWERVLKIIKTITKTGSFLPGPYGAVAQGADMIVNGIEALTM